MEGEIYSTGESRREFLGTISTSSSSTSITSQYSSYSSSYYTYSIFNRTGRYGSSVSDFSPWNPTAANPPAVLQRGVQLGFLTYNTAKTPRIDPDMMLRCINRTR